MTLSASFKPERNGLASNSCPHFGQGNSGLACSRPITCLNLWPHFGHLMSKLALESELEGIYPSLTCALWARSLGTVMDNGNLREDQKKAVMEALMLAAAAHRHIELGQAEDAKEAITEIVSRLTEFVSAPS
jgi:hypothetical protein